MTEGLDQEELNKKLDLLKVSSYLRISLGTITE